MCMAHCFPSGHLGGLPNDERKNEREPGPPEHIFVMDVYLLAIFIKLLYGMLSSFSYWSRSDAMCAVRKQNGPLDVTL